MKAVAKTEHGSNGASTSPEQEKFVFVIGPIGSPGEERYRRAKMLLDYIITPAVEQTLKVKPFRADHDDRPGSITRQVIQDIKRADLVIADLSGHNPNAFYEIGLRHSLRLPIIHMIDEETELPFDNKDFRTIPFKPFDPDTHAPTIQQLKAQIEATQKPNFEVVNPVTMALTDVQAKQSGNSTDRLLLELIARLDKVDSRVDRISFDMDLLTGSLPTGMSDSNSAWEKAIRRHSGIDLNTISSADIIEGLGGMKNIEYAIKKRKDKKHIDSLARLFASPSTSSDEDDSPPDF